MGGWVGQTRTEKEEGGIDFLLFQDKERKNREREREIRKRVWRV